MLFGLTYVIILISTVLQMMLQVRMSSSLPARQVAATSKSNKCSDQGESLSDSIWKSWTHVADPGSLGAFERMISVNDMHSQRHLHLFHPLLAGTHAGTKGLGRILGLATTVAGMLIFALMIGVVSESIGASVDSLKKGTAKVAATASWHMTPPMYVSPLQIQLIAAWQVMETGHTLILGWSEKGIALIQQIALANKSQGGLPIVVLCPERKEEMENIVKAACQRKEDRLQLHGSRVIFRTGNPLNEHDLVGPWHRVNISMLCSTGER